MAHWFQRRQGLHGWFCRESHDLGSQCLTLLRLLHNQLLVQIKNISTRTASGLSQPICRRLAWLAMNSVAQTHSTSYADKNDEMVHLEYCRVCASPLHVSALVFSLENIGGFAVCRGLNIICVSLIYHLLYPTADRQQTTTYCTRNQSVSWLIFCRHVDQGCLTASTSTEPAGFTHGMDLNAFGHGACSTGSRMDGAEPHTGTTIIACAYDGGVVLGADGRVSTGNYISNRASNKIMQLTDNVFLLRSGSAADTQAVGDYGELQQCIACVYIGIRLLCRDASGHSRHALCRSAACGWQQAAAQHGLLGLAACTPYAGAPMPSIPRVLCCNAHSTSTNHYVCATLRPCGVRVCGHMQCDICPSI